MDATIYAATHGRVEKAASIVENIIESAVRKKILIWLQNFTVITTDTVNPQKFKYSKQAKIRWNENKARENPFWTIKLKTRVVNAAPNTSATPERTAEYNIEKRQIKNALDRFFTNPTPGTKANLIAMLGQYQISHEKTNQNIKARFISGGLPSLGKKR